MSIFDIVGKRIAVNCRTEEESDAFVKLAKECKLADNWGDRRSFFGDYYDKTCYRIYKSNVFYNDIALRRGTVQLYLDNFCEIVPAEEIDELKDLLTGDISISETDISVLF